MACLGGDSSNRLISSGGVEDREAVRLEREVGYALARRRERLQPRLRGRLQQRRRAGWQRRQGQGEAAVVGGERVERGHHGAREEVDALRGLVRRRGDVASSRHAESRIHPGQVKRRRRTVRRCALHALDLPLLCCTWCRCSACMSVKAEYACSVYGSTCQGLVAQAGARTRRASCVGCGAID